MEVNTSGARVPARGLDDVQRAEHVDGAIAPRIVTEAVTLAWAARWKTACGRKASKAAASAAPSVMSTFASSRLGREPRRVARREVVDHEHLEAVAHERVDDVRADEARASGHDRPLCHLRLPASRRNHYI